MKSQSLTKEDDVIAISDDDQKVKSRKSQHRGIKTFDSCDKVQKVVQPNPLIFVPFYDLTRITYIYKVRRGLLGNWGSIDGYKLTRGNG